MSIPVAQLGWMAGIIDLRGKIVAKQNKMRRTPQMVLYVQSRHFPVVQRLAAMTGTNPEHKIVEGDTGTGWWRRGCTEHCPEAHTHVERPQFPDTMRWTVTGAPMGVVLHNLAPFLTQGDRFTVAREACLRDMVLRGRGAKATVDALRRLEALGWDFPEDLTIPDSLSTLDAEAEPEEAKDDLPGL